MENGKRALRHPLAKYGSTVNDGHMARLSVFRGSFTRDAAEQVAGANLHHLLALVNKSLLQRQAGSGRFVLHELLRQFAAASWTLPARDGCPSRDALQFVKVRVLREMRCLSYDLLFGLLRNKNSVPVNGRRDSSEDLGMTLVEIGGPWNDRW